MYVRTALTLLTLSAALGQSPPPSGVGSVHGVVVDERNQPIRRATVYGFPEHDVRRQIRVISSTDGEFDLENVPPGVVYISAFKESDGYPYNFFAFYTTTARAVIKVNVEPERRAESAVIQLGPKAASLRINITDQDGVPFVGKATLRFTREDVPGIYSIAAELPSHSMLVPPVPFRFTIEVSGYQLWTSGLVAAASGETLEIPVRLKPL